MTRNYTVQTRILKPVAEVFDAVVSREKLCEYFTSKATRDFSEGAEIGWCWAHYEFELPVTVNKVVENQLIELTLDAAKWKKTVQESYPVTVVFEFTALEDGSTMLSISEEGWKRDAEGLKGSHDNCSGWTHMAMCLKAWLEHGIDLR